MDGLSVLIFLLIAVAVIALPIAAGVLLIETFLEWRKNGSSAKWRGLFIGFALACLGNWALFRGIIFPKRIDAPDEVVMISDNTTMSAGDSINIAEMDALSRQREAREPTDAGDTVAVFRFPDMTLLVSPLARGYGTTTLSYTDTLTISEDVGGYSIDQLQLLVSSDELTNIRVDQQASVAIYFSYDDKAGASDEDSKQSAWRPMKRNKKGKLIPYVYSGADELRVLGLSPKQFEKKKQAYLKRNDYENRDEDMDYFFATDTYLLRITGKRKDTGKMVARYIRYFVQIGC